jgi:hypothetical protein
LTALPSTSIASTVFAYEVLHEAEFSSAKKERHPYSEVHMMSQIDRLFDLGLRYVFEPGLDWVLDHPIVSVVAVVLLVYWSVRGYRMV